MEEAEFTKGRGAQYNSSNPFHTQEYVTEHYEGLDEPFDVSAKTQLFYEHPKKIINKVDSPDLGLVYSMNPYQGCEHGCIYCYARNTHQYWGFSAGMDFEQKIIVKKNAPELLEKQLKHPKWDPQPIMLAGNTDCYQPVERKLEITRKMLEVLLEFRHPVGLITKNSLVLRDIDILKELAKHNLVNVAVSVTSLDESLRQKLEPRTATAKKRLEVIRQLHENNIPVFTMVAPVIPGLNDHEIPNIIEEVAKQGAYSAGYTIVRLNGAIQHLFEDWIRKCFPEKADKVLNRIRSCHAGKLNDSRFGVRMRGEGNVAKSIAEMFRIASAKHFKKDNKFSFNLKAFRRVKDKSQLDLFDE
jgi:DNA repair photolyase